MLVSRSFMPGEKCGQNPVFPMPGEDHVATRAGGEPGEITGILSLTDIVSRGLCGNVS